MRRSIISLVVAVTCSGGAANGQTCVSPAEQQALNIIAFKSSLMVGALTCNKTTQYNSFIVHFQPHIQDEQHIVDGFFQRSGGLAGQTQEDDFVTLLANEQSQSALSQGVKFCDSEAATFKTVLALTADPKLDDFAKAALPTDVFAVASCHNDNLQKPSEEVLVASLPAQRDLAPKVQTRQWPSRKTRSGVMEASRNSKATKLGSKDVRTAALRVQVWKI